MCDDRPVNGTRLAGLVAVPLRGPSLPLPRATAPEPAPPEPAVPVTPGFWRALGHRNRQPDPDATSRRLTTSVVLFVAAIAAVVSYSHIYDLALGHGQLGTAARLLPLSVDGLIAEASFVMRSASRRGEDSPRLARWMLGLGVAATVAANVAYGLPAAWLSGPVVSAVIGALVSAWPAVAFIGSIEMFVADRRVKADNTADNTADSEAGASGHIQHPAAAADQPSRPDTAAGKPPVTKQPARRRAGTPAADKVTAAIRSHPDWDDRTIAGRCGVSPRTVKRRRDSLARAALADTADGGENAPG